MAKALLVHDPYRDTQTTLTDFARNEGVPRHAVSHYFWWHRSLEGFRDRPAKGMGNGIKPHTYMRNGKYLNCVEASRYSRMTLQTLQKYRAIYDTADIDEIMRRREKELEEMKIRYETDDGSKMTISEFAEAQGVTRNAVFMWLRRKGSLKGFSGRWYSRIKPKLYVHSGLGVSKSVKEWAGHFKCSKECIKNWLRHHGQDLKGFENRKSNSIVVTHNGESGTLAEWAKRFGVSYLRLYRYFFKHRTLEGFDPARKQGRPRSRTV